MAVLRRDEGGSGGLPGYTIYVGDCEDKIDGAGGFFNRAEKTQGTKPERGGKCERGRY